jgi:hypothetical protein
MGTDEFDNSYQGHVVHLQCQEFKILKHTPKGEWVHIAYDYSPDGLRVVEVKRFVLRTARKRFACPTKKEALESLIARRQRKIFILTGQIRDAEETIRKAEDEIRGMK